MGACVDVWVDRYRSYRPTHRQMDGWVEGWVHVWVYGWTDTGATDQLKDKWMGGWKDECMCGCMGGQALAVLHPSEGLYQGKTKCNATTSKMLIHSL